MQKSSIFCGSGRRQKCNIHPADAIIGARRVGRGLTKGGGSLVGVDDSLFHCGEDTTCHDDGNCIILAWKKCLCRSIFGGKTNIGSGLWQRSHKHYPRQRATTSLKLRVSNINVVAWLSLSDVVRSWLRLQSPIDCMPHPYNVYTKCFSILICCGWARVHTHTVTHVQVGVDFRKIGGMAESK